MNTFDRPTLVTLTAPTCSGKSYLLNELVDRDIFSRIVSTTTRPKRSGEIESVDYYFIDDVTSKLMEANGEFFELIEFNRTRYGVTNSEMQTKMSSSISPIVILEPQGLEIYSKKCQERGWDIFNIYVHVTENIRLERLLQRSLTQAWEAVDTLNPSPGKYTREFFETGADQAKTVIAKVINEHQRRLLSITGDERRWSNMFTWDVIVPGDNLEKAIEMIQKGVEWRNRRRAEPQAIGAVTLPLV